MTRPGIGAQPSSLKADTLTTKLLRLVYVVLKFWEKLCRKKVCWLTASSVFYLWLPQKILSLNFDIIRSIEMVSFCLSFIRLFFWLVFLFTLIYQLFKSAKNLTDPGKYRRISLTSKCTVQAKHSRNGKVVFATLSRLGILLPMVIGLWLKSCKRMSWLSFPARKSALETPPHNWISLLTMFFKLSFCLQDSFSISSDG